MAGVALVIQPVSGRFERTDARWLDEVAALHEGLDDAAPTERRLVPAAPGSKGIVGELVVPLLSAGALTGVVEAIRVWLGRDEGRSLRLKLDHDGELSELELTGHALTDDAYQLAVSKILASIGEDR